MSPRAPLRWLTGAHLAVTLLLFATTGLCARAELEAPTIHDTIDYRDVGGRTRAQLVASLDRVAVGEPGNERFYANTHWELRWSFRIGSTGGDCHVTSASTDLTVNMSLPRWNPPPNAARDLIERWNRFSTALRRHEDGHRDIAIDAAHELARRITGTPPAGDCEKLKQSVGRRADAVLDEYRAKERRYDETTGHGRTQGATFS
jgi:predicted secreted Zn-dependent protease